MAKVIAATCVAGVVTAEGVPVPAAEILSHGVGASAGFLVIDEERAYYVAKTSPDLETAITQTVNGLTQASSGLGAASGALGPIEAATGDLGAIAAATAAGIAIGAATTGIATAIAALNTLKASLK